MPHDRATCPLCGGTLPELPLTYLPERGMLVGKGRFVLLPYTEAALFEILAAAYPRMLTKAALMDRLYQLQTDDPPEIKIIDVFVCKLRKKVEPLGARIETYWGKGYAMAVQPAIVREATGEAA